ncbi:MAG TPA: TIGR03435 family protein [Bryobacteraceae bacterium]|nr:TIGR03435 family protein [Bryobacteraceae bacterium]
MRLFASSALLATWAVMILPAWQPSAFEVADIRPSDPSIQKTGKGRILPGGRIELPGQAVRDLIAFAYGVTDDLIVGAPKWAGEERFDIVAKAPSTATPEALRAMMRTLLAERFQLLIHSEDKTTSAFVLTLGRSPLRVRESDGGQTLCRWIEANNGPRRRECRHITMEEFARELPNTGGIGILLPVKDQTGLRGAYDFEFEVGDFRQAGPEAASPSVDDSGPTIFSAMQKLGLRLEQRKIVMPAIAIDRVQRPSVN